MSKTKTSNLVVGSLCAAFGLATFAFPAYITEHSKRTGGLMTSSEKALPQQANIRGAFQNS